MAGEAYVLLMAVATGYVAAGLVASFYTLVTDRTASFNVQEATIAGRLMQVPIIVIGGPSILMRNAVRARFIENRPIGWLFLTLVIVVSWCFVSGLFVIHLALSL